MHAARTAGLLVLLLGGCQAPPGPYVDPCDVTDRVLAADEVSALGFSADEALAGYGSALVLEAGWVGRHSRTPAHDSFDIGLGAVEGEVHEQTWTPVDAGGDAALCAARDRLAVVRAVTVASADGEVTGTGTISFTLPGLAPASHAFEVLADVVLAEVRQAEIDRVLDDDLPAPERTWFAAGTDPDFGDRAEITVEGPGYGVRVWNCDEQHDGKGDCATWR